MSILNIVSLTRPAQKVPWNSFAYLKYIKKENITYFATGCWFNPVSIVTGQIVVNFTSQFLNLISSDILSIMPTTAYFEALEYIQKRVLIEMNWIKLFIQ